MTGLTGTLHMEFPLQVQFPLYPNCRNALVLNNLKDEGAWSYRLYLSLAFVNLDLFFLMCFAP